ncbi:MAG: HEAT repeat domain-containing protein [Candidatus Omnitrophica bacterium]|nr:HEAT repeat domain-containing protein [Candidatus Omnitrophota bacterium]
MLALKGRDLRRCILSFVPKTQENIIMSLLRTTIQDTIADKIMLEMLGNSQEEIRKYMRLEIERRSHNLSVIDQIVKEKQIDTHNMVRREGYIIRDLILLARCAALAKIFGCTEEEVNVLEERMRSHVRENFLAGIDLREGDLARYRNEALAVYDAVKSDVELLARSVTAGKSSPGFILGPGLLFLGIWFINPRIRAFMNRLWRNIREKMGILFASPIKILYRGAERYRVVRDEEMPYSQLADLKLRTEMLNRRPMDIPTLHEVRENVIALVEEFGLDEERIPYVIYNIVDGHEKRLIRQLIRDLVRSVGVFQHGVQDDLAYFLEYSGDPGFFKAIARTHISIKGRKKTVIGQLARNLVDGDYILRLGALEVFRGMLSIYKMYPSVRRAFNKITVEMYGGEKGSIFELLEQAAKDENPDISRAVQEALDVLDDEEIPEVEYPEKIIPITNAKAVYYYARKMGPEKWEALTEEEQDMLIGKYAALSEVFYLFSPVLYLRKHTNITWKEELPRGLVIIAIWFSMGLTVYITTILFGSLLGMPYHIALPSALPFSIPLALTSNWFTHRYYNIEASKRGWPMLTIGGDLAAVGTTKALQVFRKVLFYESLLANVLKDPDLWLQAGVATSIGAMFSYKPRETEKLLKETLRIPESKVRAGAAASIGAMFSYKPDEAEKLLREALRDSDKLVKAGAARSIGAMFSYKPDEAEKLLREALRDPDKLVRENAATNIGAMFSYKPDEAEKLLREALEYPDSSVGGGAAASIGAMFSYKPDEAEKLLRKCLEKGSYDWLRAGAAASIGAMFSYKPDEAEKLLRKALEVPLEWVQAGAAASIGAMFSYKPDEAEELLRNALKIPHAWVQKEAVTSISAMFGYKPDEAEKLLTNALKDPDWRIRAGAARSIGAMFSYKPDEAEKLLREALCDPYVIVQGGATVSMGAILFNFADKIRESIEELKRKHPFLKYVSAGQIMAFVVAENISSRQLSSEDIKRYNSFASPIPKAAMNDKQKEWHMTALTILSYLCMELPHWDANILSNRRKLIVTLSGITDIIAKDYTALKDRISSLKMRDRGLFDIMVDLISTFFRKEELTSEMASLLAKDDIKNNLERSKELVVFFLNILAQKIDKPLSGTILNTFDPDIRKNADRFFRYISLLNAFPEEYMSEYKPVVKDNKLDLAQERNVMISILNDKLKALLNMTEKECDIIKASMDRFQSQWHDNKFFERVLIQAAFFTPSGRNILKEFVVGIAGNPDRLALDDEVHYKIMRQAGFTEEFITKWKKDTSYYIKEPLAKDIKISYKSHLGQIMSHLGMAEDDLTALPEKHDNIEGLEEAVKALSNIIAFLREDKLPNQNDIYTAIGFVSSKEAKGIFNKELITDLRNLMPARVDSEELKAAPSIRITSDPNIFMRAGLEPYPTCQRCIQRTPQNKDGQLINRIRNGQFKLAQYLIGNTVIARAHLEVTLDERKDSVLLVEKIYQHLSIPYDSGRFESEIMKYASNIGIKKIYWSNEPEDIKTTREDNPAPLKVEGAIHRDTIKFTYKSIVGVPPAAARAPSAGSWFNTPGWIRNAWWRETGISFAIGALVWCVLALLGAQDIAPYAGMLVTPASLFFGLHLNRNLLFKVHVNKSTVFKLTGAKLIIGGIATGLSFFSIPLALGSMLILSIPLAIFHYEMTPQGRGIFSRIKERMEDIRHVIWFTCLKYLTITLISGMVIMLFVGNYIGKQLTYSGAAAAYQMFKEDKKVLDRLEAELETETAKGPYAAHSEKTIELKEEISSLKTRMLKDFEALEAKHKRIEKLTFLTALGTLCLFMFFFLKKALHKVNDKDIVILKDLVDAEKRVIGHDSKKRYNVYYIHDAQAIIMEGNFPKYYYRGPVLSAHGGTFFGNVYTAKNIRLQKYIDYLKKRFKIHKILCHMCNPGKARLKKSNFKDMNVIYMRGFATGDTDFVKSVTVRKNGKEKVMLIEDEITCFIAEPGFFGGKWSTLSRKETEASPGYEIVGIKYCTSKEIAEIERRRKKQQAENEQSKGSEGSGAWFAHEWYKRNIAWWFETIVSFVSGNILARYVFMSALSLTHMESLWLAAFLVVGLFWGLHIPRAIIEYCKGEEKGVRAFMVNTILFKRDVIGLTVATALASLFIPAFGPTYPLTWIAMVMVGIAHNLINKKRRFQFTISELMAFTGVFALVLGSFIYFAGGRDAVNYYLGLKTNGGKSGTAVTTPPSKDTKAYWGGEIPADASAFLGYIAPTPHAPAGKREVIVKNGVLYYRETDTKPMVESQFEFDFRTGTIKWYGTDWFRTIPFADQLTGFMNEYFDKMEGMSVSYTGTPSQAEKGKKAECRLNLASKSKKGWEEKDLMLRTPDEDFARYSKMLKRLLDGLHYFIKHLNITEQMTGNSSKRKGLAEEKNKLWDVFLYLKKIHDELTPEKPYKYEPIIPGTDKRSSFLEPRGRGAEGVPAGMLGLSVFLALSGSGLTRAEIGRRIRNLRRRDKRYSYNGIENPQEYPGLILAGAQRVKERIRDFKKTLGMPNPEGHPFIIENTIEWPFTELEKRAKSLKSIKGLKISYKQGRGVAKAMPDILLVRTQTIMDNLSILGANGIDHVKYSNLLSTSTNKLRLNILFLESIGFDFVTYPHTLGISTKTLQLNYMVMKYLGINVTSPRLCRMSEKLITQIRSGETPSSRSLVQTNKYLDMVERGETAPKFIVSFKKEGGREVAVSRKDTIRALKKLGIKNPELYPSLITLGAAVVKQRIDILTEKDTRYNFNGIKNPLASVNILTHNPIEIKKHCQTLKTPNANYNFAGINNPESYPQVLGYKPKTIMLKCQKLKKADASYSFNGISHPENYPFILIYEPETIKSKTRNIKMRLRIKDIERYPILLPEGIDNLVDTARKLDKIRGLRVSYRKKKGIEKVKPAILLVKPGTVKDNLALLNRHGIDHVENYRLLSSATDKLRRNIGVCQKIGFDFVRYPNILQLATDTLLTNYTILHYLGGAIVRDYLSRSTKELIRIIKNGRVRLNTKLGPAKIARYLDRAEKGRIRISRQFTTPLQAADVLTTPGTRDRAIKHFSRYRRWERLDAKMQELLIGNYAAEEEAKDIISHPIRFLLSHKFNLKLYLAVMAIWFGMGLSIFVIPLRGMDAARKFALRLNYLIHRYYNIKSIESVFMEPLNKKPKISCADELSNIEEMLRKQIMYALKYADDYTMAERMLDEAYRKLAMLLKKYPDAGTIKEYVAYMIGRHLGVASFLRGEKKDYSKAEKLLDKAYDRFEALYDRCRDNESFMLQATRIIAAYNSLSATLRKEGKDYTEAERILDKVYDRFNGLYEKCKDVESFILQAAYVVSGYGGLAYALKKEVKDYLETERILDKTYDAFNALYDKSNHAEDFKLQSTYIVTSYSNLAMEVKDYNEAERLLDKAYERFNELYEKCKDNEKFKAQAGYILIGYNRLVSAIVENVRDYPEAERILDKAYERLTMLLKKHPDVKEIIEAAAVLIGGYANLSAALRKKAKIYPEAERMLDKAYERLTALYEQCKGNKRFVLEAAYVIAGYNGLAANIANDRKDYSKAENLLDKSYGIVSTFLERHPEEKEFKETAKHLISGHIYLASSLRKEAKDYLASERILDKGYDRFNALYENCKDLEGFLNQATYLIPSYNSLAAATWKVAKNYSKAEKLFDKVRQKLNTLLKKDTALGGLKSQIMPILRSHQELFSYYRGGPKLRGLLEKFEGINREEPDNIISALVLAFLYVDNGFPKEARALAQRIIAIPELYFEIYHIADSIIKKAESITVAHRRNTIKHDSPEETKPAVMTETPKMQKAEKKPHVEKTHIVEGPHTGEPPPIAEKKKKGGLDERARKLKDAIQRGNIDAVRLELYGQGGQGGFERKILKRTQNIGDSLPGNLKDFANLIEQAKRFLAKSGKSRSWDSGIHYVNIVLGLLGFLPMLLGEHPVFDVGGILHASLVTFSIYCVSFLAHEYGHWIAKHNLNWLNHAWKPGVLAKFVKDRNAFEITGKGISVPEAEPWPGIRTSVFLSILSLALIPFTYQYGIAAFIVNTVFALSLTDIRGVIRGKGNAYKRRIVIGVMGPDEEYVESLREKIGGVNFIYLPSENTEERNLKTLRAYAEKTGDYNLGMIHVDDKKLLEDAIYSYIDEREQKDRVDFRTGSETKKLMEFLGRPDKARLGPSEVKYLKDRLSAIVARFNVIRSKRPADLSLYELKFDEIAVRNQIDVRRVKPLGEALKETGGRKLASIRVHNPGELSMAVRNHKKKVKECGKYAAYYPALHIRVAKEFQDKLEKKYGGHFDAAAKQEVLELLDIRNDTEKYNVKISWDNESWNDSDKLDEIYDEVVRLYGKDMKPADLGIGDSRNLGLNKDKETKVEGMLVVNMKEGEGLITQQYQIIVEIMANDNKRPALPKEVTLEGGLNKITGVIQFTLKVIEPANIEELREEMIRYEKIVMSA